jgi:hypothetical protein
MFFAQISHLEKTLNSLPYNISSCPNLKTNYTTMLDPFSALSLASNVVQFVDFASKLMSESRNIYMAGFSVKTIELETVTKDLRVINGRLTDLFLSNVVEGERPSDSEAQQGLQALTTRCREVADELLAILGELQSGSAPSRWRSFVQALKTVRKHDYIEHLQKRLGEIRSQLGVHILTQLR